MLVTAHDRRLFAQAALKAVGADAKVRVGALLARGRTTLAVCTNFASPGEPTPWKHAERQVLRDYERQFNCTLYVARLGLNGELRPSFPCVDCWDHVHYGSTVSKIVYVDAEHILRKERI